MTHEQFITKYNGRFIDFDGAYGPQCVDLMRQYIKECLNLDPYSIPRATYAKDIYKNFNGSNIWQKVKNTITAIPKKGDIIFWDWRWPVTGYAGHVAIVTGADINRFISFDQNYGYPKTCSYKNHTYIGVMGWFHKKA
jgi:hypothetical protein